MTDVIKQAEDVLVGVTEGPWRVDYTIGDRYLMSADGESLMCDMTYYPWVPEEQADWDFIAAARQLVPDLIAHARAQEALIAELVGKVEHLATWDHCWPGNINLERSVADLRTALAKLKGRAV